MKKTFRTKTLPILLLILAISTSSIAGLWYMDQKRDIPVGLILGLSGKWSQLGVDISNGVLLAVNQINANGGIAGKKISLMIYDHKSSLARADVDALIEKVHKDRVHLIIGFDTSAMTPLYDAFNQSGNFLFISPSISTTELTGIDDNILRVVPENTLQADALWSMIRRDGTKHLSVVMDTSNKSYTLPIVNRLKALATDADVTLSVTPFQSLQEDVHQVASQLTHVNPDGIVFVTNALTTATICQDLKRQDYTGLKYVCAWGMTSELIQNGGTSVEKLRGIGFFNMASQKTSFTEYVDRYRQNYGSDAPLFSLFGYDATMVLSKAIAEAGTSRDLNRIKHGLLIHRYQGVQSEFTLDRFGDCTRTFTQYHIENGTFVVQ